MFNGGVESVIIMIEQGIPIRYSINAATILYFFAGRLAFPPSTRSFKEVVSLLTTILRKVGIEVIE